MVTFAEPSDEDDGDADVAKTTTGHEKPLEMSAKAPVSPGSPGTGNVAMSHSLESPKSPETPSVALNKSSKTSKSSKTKDLGEPSLSPIHSPSPSPSGSKSDLSLSASTSSEAPKKKKQKPKDDPNSAEALRNRCIGSERRSFVAMYEILREPVLNAVEAGYQRYGNLNCFAHLRKYCCFF